VSAAFTLKQTHQVPRGLAVGMDETLTKPIQLVKLKTVLWKTHEQTG